MTNNKQDGDKNRSGGPHHEATGTTGVGPSENSGVSNEDAARNINPGGAGAAAPDPHAPDEGA
jgi:hypothetical protein